MSTDTRISEAEARELWADLKNALASTEKAIQRIIETKAWEPLGYSSFAEAWAAENSGSWLASELRAHVVLAMFEDGLDDDEVREALGRGSGVTKPVIRAVRRQKTNGVPPEHISLKATPEDYVEVPEHLRRKAPAYVALTVKMPEDTLRQYHALAKAQGRALTDVARDLLAEWAEKEGGSK